MPELVEVRLEEFRTMGAKLLDVGDRKVVLEMRKQLRARAKPIGERINAAIAEAMPERGGLQEKVRTKGRTSLLVDLRRGVFIQLSNREGMFMEQFEAGSIRHPIPWIPKRGDATVKHPWRPQDVPGGEGAKQLAQESDGLADEVLRIVTETVRRNT